MTAVAIFLVAALIFGICYVVDKAFTKAFRSKAQHRSGLAVRAAKKYGIFGVLFGVLGIIAVISGLGRDRVLLSGGLVVFLMGAALSAHYLSFGIFYDGESFLVSAFGKPSREYKYKSIQSQQLYIVTGGNVVIELQMDDGKVVSLQSSMDGIYPFLDTAFAGWCMQHGRKMEECSFYDPSRSWWFPHEEEA